MMKPYDIIESERYGRLNITTQSEVRPLKTDTSKIGAYFSHLVSTLDCNQEIFCLAVAHMVPNTLSFAPALDSIVKLSAVLPKPKSTNRPEYDLIKKRYHTISLSREWAEDADKVVGTLVELGLTNKRLVLVDIGGYFAKTINEIVSKFEGEILGVMEGTENGVARYEKYLPHDIPIVTVARSPLKLPEDFLVASSVVFSIEAVLREQAEILQTRRAAVIGYGRVGSAVAEILRGRGINTVVFDIDPIKLAEAAAKGFQAYVQRHDALVHASLIVCATGNCALDLPGFGMLKSGSIVASVTSADDELELDVLSAGYVRRDLSEHLVRYTENREGGRYFDLVANGNAANFIHGAIIGPAIQLIEGEKLFAVSALISKEIPTSTDTVHELEIGPRNAVAKIWNEHFL